MPTKQHRKLIFTVNNYTPEQIKIVKDCPMAKCIKAGLEIGASGTPHIQGAVIWKKPQSFTAAQKLICGAKCGVKEMKGSWDDQDYCLKGQQSHEEWEEHQQAGPNYGLNAEIIRNDEGPQQGKRNDIIAFRDAIRSGKSDDELNSDFAGECAKFNRYIQFTRDAKLEAGVVPLERGSKKMLTWLWSRGPNMGKTSHVCDKGDVYDKPSNKWWDCYNNESIILIDDPTPKWNEHLWGYLKQWCNEKPFIAEIKGRSRKIRPSEFYVCANCPPDEYFLHCYDKDVFMARCKEIVEVTSPMWE